MRNRTRSARIRLFCATALTSLCAHAETISVPADETLVLNVTNAVVGVRPGIEGALRKEGDGLLTLDDADFPNGMIDVRMGTLALLVTNGTMTAELPLWAQQTATLWFDANTNVVTGAGTNGVVQWLDARESDQEAPHLYPRAIQHDDDPIPLLGTGDTAIHGQRYLDFGGIGSDRWLKWVNPDDSRLAVSNIVQAFIVFGRQAGFGFLLGDWDWNQAGNVGRKDFHIADTGPGGTNCFFWIKDNTAATVIYGRTCLNGRLIDGLRTKPDEGYQVFDVTTLGNALASNFCNDHNFKVGDAGGIVGYDRQGGPRYCEVLVFTNRLTAAQRTEVLDYLSVKWMTRTRRAGMIDTVAGTEAGVETAAGQLLTVGALSGKGRLTKTGDGTLCFDNDQSLFRGAVRLTAGSIESAVQRTDRPFVAETGGHVFDVGVSTASRAALQNAACFRKTRSGTLTLCGISNAVASVDVAAGTLRLSTPFVASTSFVQAAIPNASFESHAAVTQNAGKWQTGLQPTGWAILRDGVSTGGISLDWADTPWVAAGGVPDGESAFFFQYAGGIATTVQVSRAGIYRLSFQAAARYDYAIYRPHAFGIWLGTQQVAVAKTYDPFFKRYDYTTTPLTNGAYELRFKGIVATVNRSSVIDDVRLELIDNKSFADLPNSSFEYSAHIGTDSAPAVYAFSPDGAAWTFEGSNACGLAEATPLSAPGLYFARSVPDGKRCAFITADAVIRQTLRFPTTGEVYRLTFQAAAREKNEGHAFKVLFGGAPLIPYMQTALPAFHTCEITLPPITNWTAELSFAGITTNSPTQTSLFDDIRVFRADDALVPNGSFETTTSLAENDYSGYATLCAGAEWVFEAGAGALRSGIGGTVLGYPDQGARMAFLNGDASIRQTLTLPSAGAYVLSFRAAGRPDKFGHAFEVCWGGTRLGVVAADDVSFRTYTFRMPYAAAETSQELMFRGLVGQEVGSLLDNVMIERVGTCGSAGLLPDTVAITVAAGAKLDLDFDGTLTVKGVTLGGLEKSQIISATTCPDYVTGAGALYTPQRGTLIKVR